MSAVLDARAGIIPAPPQPFGPSRPNPFEPSSLARANSAYAAPREGNAGLVHPFEPGRSVSAAQEFVHDSFRALVLNPRFSCVGAKSAVQRGSYRVGLYGTMGTPEATMGLARDLFAFVEDQSAFDDGGFSTFAASFEQPVVASEAQFESLLWTQLQRLHDEDRLYFPWDAAVSSDPADGSFEFSFGERAFFVVGLHPASSRLTRRFAFPTLVFNAHYLFERLRQQGRFDKIQQAIQDREIALQGSLNPNLANFGHSSDARQYSGRPVEDNWKCPFQRRLLAAQAVADEE
jgi:FPC/CPF motif-containing protein YcgG